MKRRTHSRLILICVLSCAGIAGLAWLWLVYLQPRYSVRLTSQGEIAISRRTAADEQPPTAEQRQGYTVAAEAPRYLKIEKLGVNARVLPVGRSTLGEVAAPAGIWDVGWYDASARPGEAGVSFIDGHISGPTLPAVFKDLHALSHHDDIVVERGDGALLHYKVESVQVERLADIDMNALLTTVVDGKPTLVLMTCGGEFNEKSYTYDRRVVVISTLL